jgi:O-antigen ligase
MRTVAYCFSILLVFTVPWENAITFENWGTLTRAIGMAAAASWLFSAMLSRTVRRPHLFHLLMFLFVLWNISSLFWTYSLDDTIRLTQTYAQMFLMVWILWDLCTTPAVLRTFLAAYIVGAYVSVGSVIANFLAGQVISVGTESRYSGAGMNANELAIILALGIPVAWHLATTAPPGTRSRILQLLSYAYVPICLPAILLTGTRTGLFVSLPGLLFVVFTSNRLKSLQRVLVFAVLAAGAIVLVDYIPSSTLDRLATTGASISTWDLGGRVRLWSSSLDVYSNFPILGVGAGSLHAPLIIGVHAHNTFISILAELGPIGLILFAAILIVVFSQAVRQPNWLSQPWITILVTWLIAASTLTWEYTKQTWLFLSLVIISTNLVEQSRMREERAAPYPSPAEGIRLRSAGNG